MSNPLRSTQARLLLFVGVAALAACSSTQIKDSWKDPAYSGPAPKSVLVIGVSKSAVNRRVFEDGFVAALRAAGSGGSASYTVLPEANGADNNAVFAAAGKAGADAVLVTQVLRARRDVQVTPGYASPGFYGRGFHGYYGGAWATTPDVNVYDVLTIESTLWNMKTDKPVWSGTSEVTDPGTVAKATEDIAKALIGKMKADGVI